MAKIKRIRTDLTLIALLLALSLLFHWRIVTPKLIDRGAFPPGDFVEQFYAFATYESQQLRAGHIPLWNPYTFSGHPFLADVQSAIFYPVSLLTILLTASKGITVYALEIEAIFHYFLASAFTYLFVKEVTKSRAAALVSAVTFAYGGYLTGYPPLQLAVLETDVWLPLILFFIARAASPASRFTFHVSRLTHYAAAGFFFGVAILAGHPQSALFVGYVAVAYLIWRVWRISRREIVVALLIFGIIAAGISAIQLLPSYEFMQLSTRTELSYEKAGGGLPIQNPLEMLMPSVLFTMSGWNVVYAGVLPLLLAIFALARATRARVSCRIPKSSRLRKSEYNQGVAFWGITALIAGLLAWGKNVFFYAAFYLLVPGFALFRSWERSIFVFSFALAILAGYGAAAMLHVMNRAEKRHFAGFYRFVAHSGYFAIGLTFVFYAIWVYEYFGRGAASRFLAGKAVMFAVLLLLARVIFQLRLSGAARRSVIGAAMVALIVFDLFTANWETNFVEKQPAEHEQLPVLVQQIPREDRPYRVFNEWELPGNYGCLARVEDTWGASPLKLQRYEDFVNNLPEAQLWRLLNVKYVLTWREGGALPLASQVIYQETKAEEDKRVYLHKLIDVYPRAYVVHQVDVIPNDTEQLQRLSDPNFNPLERAVVSRDLGIPNAAQVNSSAQIVERRAERMVIEVDAAADGLLVLSELYYPGWQARVDGRKTEIIQANYVLRAVPITAGKHRVEVWFAPLSVTLGAIISILTVILFLTVIFRPDRFLKLVRSADA